MRIGFLALSVVCFAGIPGPPCLQGSERSAGAEQDAARKLALAPLRFEPAQNDASRFVARGFRFQYSFERNSVALLAGKDTVCLAFDGASKTAQVEGSAKLRSVSNVLRGNDPKKWRTSIPNYGRLQVRELYPGIDVVYYGNGRELEYDLTLNPGADPARVRLRFNGADAHIDSSGNLAGGFFQKRPVAYQIAAAGGRVPVESRYRRNPDGTFGFTLGRYDKARPVVIDPVLLLSYYFGGSDADYAVSISHDAPGFIYAAGTTYSPDYLSTANAYQSVLGGTSDIFFVKIDPNAALDSQVIISTLIGGTGAETLGAMTATPESKIFLTGNTTSSDLPTVNPQQSAIDGTSDAFIMMLDPSQSGSGMLVYSTYLGGADDDYGNGITYDAQRRIVVAGTTRSPDFPFVSGVQSVNGSNQTAFVSIIDTTKTTTSTLVYSTYIGGAGGETGTAIAVSPDGTVWVVGGTYSTDFPVAGYTYDYTYQDGGDAFVAQINVGIPGSGGILYATYLGGSGPDEAKSVVVDPARRVIVSGYTGSSDFPVTVNALQTAYGGNFDAFVTILNTVNPQSNRATQLVYSTFYGGSEVDIAFDLKLDPAGNIYVAGLTDSPNIPVSRDALQPTYNLTDLTQDGFALELNPERAGLEGLVYGSYIASDGLQAANGIDYDSHGNIWVAGYTSGPLLDDLGGAVRSSPPGNTDAFVMAVDPTANSSSAASSTAAPGDIPKRVHRR
jgi:hypothetical protein